MVVVFSPLSGNADDSLWDVPSQEQGAVFRGLRASRLTFSGVLQVHVPSSTVYQNWPTERSPLRYVTAADFR